MSRIVTASEVDKLHQQVAELQKQVAELQQAPNLTPSKSSELFERSLIQPTALAPIAETPVDVEAEEEAEGAIASQETRSAADPVVDVLASESPSAI